MSTTATTQKTITEASEETETAQIDLKALVAQTTGNADALPDWNQFNAACKLSLETIERVAAGEI